MMTDRDVMRIIRFYARCVRCGYYETTHQGDLSREACGIDHEFEAPWDEERVGREIAALAERPDAGEG